MSHRFAWLTQAMLYKYRFFIGYALIIAIVLVTLLVDINSLPNGISQAEMQSAVTSVRTAPRLQLDWLINLPYHVIQKLSISSLSLSRSSLVVPSVLFAISTLWLFWATIRHWFKKSTAIIATLVASTSIPFVSMLRSGTPDIMLPFWTILFIFASIRFLVNREKAFGWKLLIALATIGLLYTPYGIYSLLAFLIGGVMHPHVRSRIRHVRPKRIIILASIIVIGSVLLLIACFQQPALVYTLTGIDQVGPSFSAIGENALRTLMIYGDFMHNSLDGTVIIPAFNIASVALILLGLFQLVQQHHTARAYALLTWTAIMILITLVVAPHPGLLLMPALMLLAIGARVIVDEWYTLFPLNPYARLAGLIPLAILFIGIATGNLAHYFHTFRYTDTPAYSASLAAVKRSVITEGNRATVLVTDPASRDFYAILQRKYKNLQVTTELPTKVVEPTFVLPSVNKQYPSAPSRIFVTSSQKDTVILRVYRP